MDKLVQVVFYGFFALMVFRMIRGGGGCCSGYGNHPPKKDNDIGGSCCKSNALEKERIDV